MKIVSAAICHLQRHFALGISMKGAIMQGFLYLHGRSRRVRICVDASETTLSSFPDLAFLYAISA